VQCADIHPAAVPLPIAKTGFYTNTLPAWVIIATGGPIASIDVMLVGVGQNSSGCREKGTILVGQGTTHTNSTAKQCYPLRLDRSQGSAPYCAPCVPYSS